MSTQRRAIWSVVAVVTIVACGAVGALVFASGSQEQAEAGPPRYTAIEHGKVAGLWLITVSDTKTGEEWLILRETSNGQVTLLRHTERHGP